MTARRNTKTTIGTPDAPIPAGWFVTGRGKTANYFAAVDGDETALVADAVVALTAKTGAVTYGRLVAPAASLDDKATARIPAGIAVWEFKRDNAMMTPELRATNAALKAEARAEFLRSEAGIAQAERIAARAAKREAEAAAGMPDTRTVTTRQATAAELAPAAPAATDSGTPSLAAQAEALKAAGFTAAEILAALSTVNPPAAPAATVKAPAKTPAKPRPITVAGLNAAAGKRAAK